MFSCDICPNLQKPHTECTAYVSDCRRFGAHFIGNTIFSYISAAQIQNNKPEEAVAIFRLKQIVSKRKNREDRTQEDKYKDRPARQSPVTDQLVQNRHHKEHGKVLRKKPVLRPEDWEKA